MPVATPAQNPYESFVAELYDYMPAVAGRRDVNFFLQEARRTGGPVLELGCGTGRVLLDLARAGYKVTGLDLATPMLERCRAKLANEAENVRGSVRLHHADMAEFDLDETFSLIVIPFRPFQHLLGVPRQLSCLRAAHRHLARGGRLIFDCFQTDPQRMHDPAFLKETSPSPEVLLPHGRKMRQAERTVAFHRAEQCNDVELIHYITHPDGRKERLVFAFTVRYFFRYEVEHLLARAGFRVAALYGDFERSPLRDDSPEMLFVAEKIEG